MSPSSEARDARKGLSGQAAHLGGVAILLALLAVATAAPAHPHVFVNCRVGVRFGADGLEAVRLAWTFDEDTSATLLERFPATADGFAPSAIQQMEREHARQFEPLGFFLEVRVNDSLVPAGRMHGFDARVERGLATHAFTVPVTAPSTAGVVQIDVADDGFYIAFALIEPVAVEVAGPYLVDCRVARDPASQRPEGVKCSYRRHSP